MKENSPFQTAVANQVFQWCQVTQEPLPLSTQINDTHQEIFSFAARNGVAPWCYYQFKKHKIDALPSELEQQFKMQYLQTLLMNRQKWKVFSEMNHLARQNNITIIPLKGTALAFTLYPQEALRPMGDIDILVPEEQIDRFSNIMHQRGATRIHQPISKFHVKFNAHIPAILWQNIMIEPHRRLFALGSTLNPTKADLFSETFYPQKLANICVFNDTMQAYHLAGHIFKGYQMGAMRLSWLSLQGSLTLLVDDRAGMRRATPRWPCTKTVRPGCTQTRTVRRSKSWSRARSKQWRRIFLFGVAPRGTSHCVDRHCLSNRSAHA